MPVEEKKVTKMQNIILENRSKLNISGVIDVLNFDDALITIDTELGVLVVKGENLRLNKLNLDNTEACVEGEIISLNYNDRAVGKRNNESLLTKIFK